MARLRAHLLAGQVIPAMPLALHGDGSWSQRHQRALVRYYLEAGAGGLAVGVHSTQFEIRDPEHDLFEPVLRFCAETIEREGDPARPFVRIAGVCGEPEQAVAEARFAAATGYDAALVSLSARGKADDAELVDHCRRVAEVLPVIGFYLQPAIGGRSYGLDFWRAFAEIENVVGVKVAPFDRYATHDVVRAVAESGRDDIALYTGNDDHIVGDLLTPFHFAGRDMRFAGGLLGQWAVGTRRAVGLLEDVRRGGGAAEEWAAADAALTDLNGALFDAGNGFSGCLAGINEGLRRDGLVPSARCLSDSERLSPGQAEEIDRVWRERSEWLDSPWIAENLERWLGD